eukprot:tig00000157_g9645.t1
MLRAPRASHPRGRPLPPAPRKGPPRARQPRAPAEAAPPPPPSFPAPGARFLKRAPVLVRVSGEPRDGSASSRAGVGPDAKLKINIGPGEVNVERVAPGCGASRSLLTSAIAQLQPAFELVAGVDRSSPPAAASAGAPPHGQAADCTRNWSPVPPSYEIGADQPQI